MDDPHAATGTEGEREFLPVLRVEPDEKLSAHKSLSGTHVVHIHSPLYIVPIPIPTRLASFWFFLTSFAININK